MQYVLTFICRSTYNAGSARITGHIAIVSKRVEDELVRACGRGKAFLPTTLGAIRAMPDVEWKVNNATPHRRCFFQRVKCGLI